MGDTVIKAGHGATGDQEGTDPEEEGDKTLQRALPARGNNGGEDKARGPPKRLCALNKCIRQGGEGGGGPPNQQRAHTTHSRGTGGTPEHDSVGPHHAARTRPKNGAPSPSTACNPRA